MPTTRRLICDDSIYHVVQRGNNGQGVFRDDEDYEKFLSLMRWYIKKFAFALYHYCLMPTHIHLLLKVLKKETLAKIMQGLLQSYRFYYRKKYSYLGYLYQGRYRSKIIENDEYLLECGRYIERNPVRARLVESAEQYKWSSGIFYIAGLKNDIVTEDPLYSSFGKNIQERRRFYKDYVSIARPYEEIMDKEFGIGERYCSVE